MRTDMLKNSDTKHQDSRPHKQSERSTDAVATAPLQSHLKPKPKTTNTVNDAVKQYGGFNHKVNSSPFFSTLQYLILHSMAVMM